MASPRSSTDEGEIVERRGAVEYPKAKTHAAAPAASHRLGNGSDVDRRDRNSYRRGRSPRSPDRGASNNSIPLRGSSPRNLKRQRDDRWENGREARGRDFRSRYDDRERDRDRDRDGDDRDDRDRYASRRRGDGNRYGDDKRPRTRSRSPPPSSYRGGRNDRARQDYARDRNRARDRRDDRGGRGWDDRSGRLPYGNGDRQRSSTPRSQQQQQQHRAEDAPAGKPTKGVSFDLGNESLSASGAPLTPQELVEPEPEPIDEDEEIRRRRQRRENTLKKFASTPSLPVPVQADKAAASPAAESNTQVNTPETGSNVNTPRSGDAANTEDLDLADDRAFMDALGKHATGNGSVNGPDTQDGPSAADYDPTVDMEIDERRDELRHGGGMAGLHGDTTMEDGIAVNGTTHENAPVDAPAAQDNAEEEADDDDDDDDMFAEDFVEKKYETSKATTGAKDTTATINAISAPANKGGILEGDDHQGYYKIRHGELLDGRYQIVTALGKGMFSGVARARDMATPDKREVAIKIMRNNDALRKGGYTEIAILQKLNEADPDNKKHLVRFERSFDYRGHLCMAFENLSMNLREVLKKFGNNVGINLHGVRVFAYQIFVGLAHMRRCSIIHADLKPDNILVNETRTILKICDLGTAIDRSDAASAHNEITPYLVSRFYRAPEIILGMPYDYAVDMWSIGCTLYELYTGKILFTGESNNQMLRAIMEVRGKISAKLYRRGELWPMHFDDMGGFLSQEHDKFQAKTTIKTMAVVKPTRDLRTRLVAASVGLDDVEAKELNQFHDLLDRCLCLNPDKRILPTDALKHPFFTQRPVR